MFSTNKNKRQTRTFECLIAIVFVLLGLGELVSAEL